jgi:hypothetical protein
MKLDNFLPISRQLQKHWIYKDSSYLHGWLDMLFNARFSNEPKTDIYKGVLYTINRGEFIYSRPTYAARLGITEGKLRTLIKLLISDGMIEEVKSLGNNKPTIYKIINYDSYNSQPSERIDNTDVEQHNNQVRTKSQPSGNQVTTKSQPLKNNVNTEKKEKNKKTFLPDSDEYRLSELLLNLIRVRNPNYKEPNLQTWSGEINKMIRIDSRTAEEIEFMIKWCQKDSFWKTNILSTYKLREKFPQLLLTHWYQRLFLYFLVLIMKHSHFDCWK